jgi:hypothetical protein
MVKLLLVEIVALNVVLWPIYCDPIRIDNNFDDNGYGDKSIQQAIAINQATSGNKIWSDNGNNNHLRDSQNMNERRSASVKGNYDSRQLPECILKTADFYLWWLNEDGTLNFDQTGRK